MSTKIYSGVIAKISDWPIFRLSEDRKKFIDEINQFTFDRLKKNTPQKIADIIASVIFQERLRMKDSPWKIDPPNDAQFWSSVNKKLVREVDTKNLEAIANNEKLLFKIINRYSEEIVGTFKIATFLFARRFLTAFFSRILNSASAKGAFESAKRLIFGGKLQLLDRFKVHGDIEHIRSVFTKGTVVVVPTHFSNLDSILVGFVMDTILGLPSFSYGAGLNLYNNGIVAYFLNRMGTYRVDRRKKNSVYLETLKAMSSLSIQRGTNTLFFPGGTRSRSGALETRLKMGLLGTAVEAQRANFQKGDNTKIFIVPLVMSYHFVLEGNSLIQQYLRSEGKERYTRNSTDEFYSIRSVSKYIWQFLSEESEITCSFGKPMDIFGNPVNEQGESIGKNNQIIDIKEYFVSNSVLNTDLQREGEYTKILAEKIVTRYFEENVVLSSHLIAFAVFKMLEENFPKIDIYGILRLPADDFSFQYELVKTVVSTLQNTLQEMEQQGKIKLSEQIFWQAEALIQHGISEIGIYHLTKPLEFDKQKDIVSHDFALLYFYHNRLMHYNIEASVQWEKYKPTLA